MAAKTKQDYQSEISGYEKQVEDLIKRRGQLDKDADRIEASIVQQGDGIADAIIAGTDPGVIMTALERERSKLDGVRKAITGAGVKIADLKNKIDSARESMMLIDFRAAESDLKSIALDALIAAFTLVESFEMVNAQRGELAKISMDAKYQSLETTQIFKTIGNLGLDNLLIGKIKRLEKLFPDLFDQARALQKKTGKINS